jgi:hypothetical protein
MKVIDLKPEHEALYFNCLEDWSDEIKEAGGTSIPKTHHTGSMPVSVPFQNIMNCLQGMSIVHVCFHEFSSLFNRIILYFVKQ